MDFKIGDTKTTKAGEEYVVLDIISASVRTGGVLVQFTATGIEKLTDSKAVRTGSLSSKTKQAVKVGDTYGRLVVVGKASAVGSKNTTWKCSCSCGGTTITSTIHLTSGHTKSCGCWRIEQAGQGSVTHGMTGSKEYVIWYSMKQRCYYPNNDNYHRYGGRGIRVCPEWLNDFQQFYNDMGNCPEGLTLERKDCNGHYEPANCKWASKNVQGFNTNVRANNTTGRTGVYFNRRQGKWTAAIGTGGKLLHLGTFETQGAAQLARAEAEIKYYGFNKE